MDETGSTPSQKRFAVVTGANKGIGLEICRQLACKGVIVMLTARDEKRGVEAVEKLKESGVPDAIFHQLDVADPVSVASLADFVNTKWGKLDILVNNAGANGVILGHEALGASPSDKEVQMPLIGTLVQVNNAGANGLILDHEALGASPSDKELSLIETCEKAEECIDTNYSGTRRVTEALLPLLQLSTSPRIVMVSSTLGKLRFIPSERVKEELNNVDSLTEARQDELWQSFLKDFRENKLDENGWPTQLSAYKVSKALMSAYTRILAKRHPNFCINCVCPGFVKTDINWNNGVLTVDEGAKGPVMLALLPDGGPSGFFFDSTEASSFD